MEPNKRLSEARFLAEAKKGLRFEIERVNGENLQPLLVHGRQLSFTFSWGWNRRDDGIKNHEDIDDEASRVLLKNDLFHIIDRVSIKQGNSVIEEVDGAYTKYATPFMFFLKN